MERSPKEDKPLTATRVFFLCVVLPALAVAILGFNHEAKNVRPAFFEAAVQVIPVLVLAIVFEARFYSWVVPLGPQFKAAAFLTLMWIVAGEAAAFRVLTDGQASHIELGLTIGALVSTATTLVAVAVDGHPARPAQPPPR